MWLVECPLSSSEFRVDMLRKSISPASSSTLMYQGLRSRVRQLRKCIGSISYSSAQSSLAHICLVLWNTRERRSSTRGWVYDQSFTNRVVMPSDADFSVTQLVWHGPLMIVSSWEDSVIEGKTLTLNTFSHSLALDRSFSSTAAACASKRKALSPAVRYAY